MVNKEWPWDQGFYFFIFLKGFGGEEIDWVFICGVPFYLFFSCILGIWSICHHHSNFPCYGATEFQSLLTWQAQKNKELKKSRGDNKGVHTHTHTHMRLYTSIEWKLVIERSPLVGEGGFYWLVSSFKMGLYRVVRFGFCVA